MCAKLNKLGENDGLFHIVAGRFGKLWEKVLNGEGDADDLALVV